MLILLEVILMILLGPYARIGADGLVCAIMCFLLCRLCTIYIIIIILKRTSYHALVWHWVKSVILACTHRHKAVVLNWGSA